MKYFSVNFIPEKADVNKKAILISILFGDLKNKMLSKLIFICAFILIGFFMNQYELIYYSFLAFILVPKIADIITVLSQIKMTDKSFLGKRPVTVDFYGDHIVYSFGSTERYKGTFEKHYAFRDVTNVIDSNNSIAFAFGEKDSVIIPKRSLDAESSQMIKNLIDNFFSSKFIKVDI
ncbi:MAG: hypothetical protein IKV21_03360 [Clostridia bacterium]|nr:hypothetical protein [Clostridia bacterium]